MQQIERDCGSLPGWAVSDALGKTLEFCRPGTFAPINDMIGGGPFQLRSGEWTVKMALAISRSYFNCIFWRSAILSISIALNIYISFQPSWFLQ